ncbi:glutathione S-transferase family protein [Planktotalea arctica]|uniref:glutathione S-transferase family protein n=1 Tax=Planktotalea arctica TaxID=1481893 RepID=UPI0032195454
MYEVFGSVASRAFRVLWALEELGASYTLTHAKPHDPVLTAIYPAGKVPALRVGEDVITDSTAIMTYLADKHGTLIAPAGTIARAQQDAIIHAVNDELDGVLWAGARHSFILPEEQRVPAVKPSLKWEFNRNVNRLADRITTPFAAGDEFTIADILLTHCLNWAVGAKFEHDNEQMHAYAKTMRDRDAFKRVRALG